MNAVLARNNHTPIFTAEGKLGSTLKASNHILAKAKPAGAEGSPDKDIGKKRENDGVKYKSVIIFPFTFQSNVFNGVLQNKKCLCRDTFMDVILHQLFRIKNDS